MSMKLYEISREKTAPMLLDYVKWILQEAQARHITTLYFLARDGYVLRELAEKVCAKNHISIRCRYLYCSRASLRMPSYHLIGEEAYELLFLYGFHITAGTFFERAGIDENHQKMIFEEIGYENSDLLNRELTRRESSCLADLLRQNKMFNELLIQNSREAFAPAIRYLEQEEVFKQDTFAIVDSGWAGSMQRSFRQLLASKGFSGKIVGFYFGMFSDQKSAEDGEYLTWYFNKQRGLRQKAAFCNNVFECMLSAPHGMTTGYRVQQDRVIPVQAKVPGKRQLEQINTQLQGILDGAEDLLCHGTVEFHARTAYKRTYTIVKELMFDPSREIVSAFGSFLFCDDVTEENLLPLASPDEVARLKEYNILSRIWNRLYPRSQAGAVRRANLFWPYGTAALLPHKLQRLWYRENIFLWELLKYIRN